MEIPWCEPLDEPDLMIGTILVNRHRTVLSTYVHTCGLGMVRNGTRKRYIPICPQTLTDISAKARAHKEIMMILTKIRKEIGKTMTQNTTKKLTNGSNVTQNTMH